MNRAEGRLFNCFISYTGLYWHKEMTLIPNYIDIRIYDKHADTHDILGYHTTCSIVGFSTQHKRSR